MNLLTIKLIKKLVMNKYPIVFLQFTKVTFLIVSAILSPGIVFALAVTPNTDTDSIEVFVKSCSAYDVQSALNIAPDGATVVIPAGDCDWGSETVNGNSGVWLKGAGKSETIIRRTANITGWNNYMIEFDCSNKNSPVEVSHMTFQGNLDLQTEAERLQDEDNGLLLSHSCTDFKIHDVLFTKFSTAGLTIRGENARGVVYSNEFISNWKGGIGYGVVVVGDPDKPRPALDLGSQNAVFIEDNYFYDNRHGVASNHGSRYVARYNTLIATERTRNYSRIDAHGRGAYGSGSASWEIYHNTFQSDPSNISSVPIITRGGDGVIFNNTSSSSIPYLFVLHDESLCTGNYPAPEQVRAAYIWNNQAKGTVRVMTNNCTDFFKENRDYFLKPLPGYTPYAYPHPLR